jgi:hypothetical protein
MDKLRLRALFAVVLVLAQAIAVQGHRPAAAFASGFVAVCTADGLRRLPAGDDQAPRHDGEHCALCRLAEPVAAAAPIVVAAPTPLPEPVAAPAAAFVAGRPVSHDAPPRAPPAAA